MEKKKKVITIVIAQVVVLRTHLKKWLDFGTETIYVSKRSVTNFM